MAKRAVEGQLDMFELFDSVEEMERTVKGVEEEPERPAVPERGLMRCFRSAYDTEFAVIAYLDYRKVYFKDWNKEAVLYQFSENKEAIDFYVEKLAHFREDKTVSEEMTVPKLKEVKVTLWDKDEKDPA